MPLGEVRMSKPPGTSHFTGCKTQHTSLPGSSLLQEALPDCLDSLEFCRKLLGGGGRSQGNRRDPREAGQMEGRIVREDRGSAQNVWESVEQDGKSGRCGLESWLKLTYSLTLSR